MRSLLFAENASAPETVTIFLAAPLAELLARCRVTEPRTREAGFCRVPKSIALAARLPLSRPGTTVDTSGIPPAMSQWNVLSIAYERMIYPHPDR